MVQGFVEAGLQPAIAAQGQAPQPLQFERLGYFVRDRNTPADGALVFNRATGLKDGWKA